jgi:replication factor C small subunit
VDETVVWAEKYRPKRLGEVINQSHAIERIKAFAKSGSVPHMLFSGPAGVGKTATALALARDLYGDAWRANVLELNASDERGIEVIRSKVKDFARTRTLNDVGYRLVILDEADALTQDAQHALRRTMESYASVSRFILICNWSSKIIDPIQSRCAIFRFQALNEADQRKYVERVAKAEKLNIDHKAVDAVIYLSEGDLRKVTNLLQASAALGKKITSDAVYEVASMAKPDDVRKMLELSLAGSFDDARRLLQDLILKQGLAGSDVIKSVHREVYKLDLDERDKIKLIEKVGEFEFRLNQGSNDLIQLEALLAQFLLFGKNPRK